MAAAPPLAPTAAPIVTDDRAAAAVATLAMLSALAPEEDAAAAARARQRKRQLEESDSDCCRWQVAGLAVGWIVFMMFWKEPPHGGIHQPALGGRSAGPEPVRQATLMASCGSVHLHNRPRRRAEHHS